MSVRAGLFALVSTACFAAPLLGGESAPPPISLHPANPHYFLFRGRPAALITSAEHYGSVINADFDWRKYLATLRADGLNYTRIFTGSYREKAGAFGIRRNTLAPADGRFIAPWAASATPGYAAGGNKFDLDRWNDDYFRRLRDFVGEAGKAGIVVEVTLFSSIYEDVQWSVCPVNPSNNVNGITLTDRRKAHTLDNGNLLGHQERLVRKIVGELAGFDNVIYEIQNEPWSDRTVTVDPISPYWERKEFPNAVDFADDASRKWQAAVAGWITDAEAQRGPVRHLIAQNICNFRYPAHDPAPGVSILNFHYAFPEAVTWNFNRGKLIAYDESGFAGGDDAVYRRQAWNFLLAGGGLFNNLDYSFTVGHEDGTDEAPNGPGGGSRALRRQLKVLSEFMHALDLPSLSPDARVVRRTSGVRTQALSAPGRQYALYITGPSPCEIELSLAPGSYVAEWVNPLTGEVSRRDTLERGTGERTLKSPEFDGEIALRILAARQAQDP